MPNFMLYIITFCILFILIIAIIQIKKELSEIKDTLNLILNKYPPSSLNQTIFNDTKFNTLILKNQKIKAIKRYRELTNSSLVEANQFVESLLNK